MTKTNAKIKPASVPAVIVYGAADKERPRAGTFPSSETAAARKAAAKLGFSVIDVHGAAPRDIATKLPSGRIQEHGRSIVPFVRNELFEQVKALVGSPSNASTTAKQPARSAKEPRRPNGWADIKAGDLVLTQDTDPADGWWQAIVVEQTGDTFKLRWLRSPRGRPLLKHRLALGLTFADGFVPATLPNAENSKLFPKDWASVAAGSVVLAKEDGPCEQWWEAKVITHDEDVISLQWRDHPHLPPIRRQRADVALTHPLIKRR